MRTITTTFLLLLLVCLTTAGNAQLLNRLKDEARQRAENRAVNKTGELTDEALDEVERGLDGEEAAADEEEQGDEEQEEQESRSTRSTSVKSPAGTAAPSGAEKKRAPSFRNYDFVPGDRIIFDYDMRGEQDAEIPGRIILNNGSAEIQSLEGEKTMMVPDNTEICFKPLMSSAEYLPEQYTLEFDYRIDDPAEDIELYVSFREKDDNECDWGGTHAITLARYSNKNRYAWSTNSSNGNPMNFPSATEDDLGDFQGWRHIAIYVNKNIGKLYVDNHRIAVVNSIVSGAQRIEFSTYSRSTRLFFKNFRIAAGGTDAYNKVVTEGKFVASGIQFDVNKASLKPQSMGTINELAQMLSAHPELRFEIGGHTDSDGSAADNLKLSQLRAETVRKELVAQGVDPARLTTRGYGSTKPVADNASPEGKARNRRVEFVKTN